MRYLRSYLVADLAKKLVLLSGPRQVGKSTLAQALCEPQGVYLNWDIRSDRRIINQMLWPKDVPLVVLDELHKMRRWKNFLKGVIDEYHNRPSLLVTGSAQLDALRRQGDALTGRTFRYRLHPIDLEESANFLPQVSAPARLQRLLQTGGFPEAFLHPTDADRLRNDRLDFVLREDVLDVQRVNSLRGVEQLIELLRERVGGQISYSSLAQDLHVAPQTAKAWVELLERLFIIFLVPPYSRGLARSLRKEPKVYFYDCAAAYDEGGPRLENLVACSLLKYCHLRQDAQGKQARLFYFRDREKREVDFVVTEGRRVQWCIEVKTTEATVHPALRYLCQRLQPERGIQLVANLSQPLEQDGIALLPAAAWLERLAQP